MTHSNAYVTLFTTLLVSIIFLPVLYDSTTPFRNYLSPWSDSDKPFTTFEPYEYEASKWLRVNFSALVRRTTVVLSDPFTINLMTSLTGFKSPYQRQWIEVREYSEDDLQIMEDIRSTFFNSININEKTLFLKTLFEKTNTSSAIIIINGRTTHWLSAEKMFICTYSGIPYSVDLDYLKKFSIVFSVSPIYYVINKLYIYKIDLNDIPNFVTSTIRVIADDNNAQSGIWKTEADGNGTIDVPTLSDSITIKAVGKNSLKISSRLGKKEIWRIFRSYISEGMGAQDWSKMDYIAFYWHGTSSGKPLKVHICTISDGYKNVYRYDLIENWDGLKLIVLYLRCPTISVGQPDLSQVTRICFSMYENAEGDRWLDFIIIGSLKS